MTEPSEIISPQTALMPADVAPTTLAIVRCGDESLHHSWSGAGRRFDVGVSYFGDLGRDFPEAKYVQRAKGGKWDSLFGFFNLFPNVIEEYDYFWFPDDDIITDVYAVNKLCEIVYRHKLNLCQLSLDVNSFYSYLVTLQHSSFEFRYTNFVEIMAPLLSREVLKETLPMFEKARSGFGLDHVWPMVAARIGGDGGKSSAIIDCVSMCHTRPVGGPLYKMLEKMGGPSPLDELRAVMDGLDVPLKSSGYGIAVPRVRILSGWDRHGKFRRGVGIVPTIILDLLFRGRNKARGVNSMAVIKHALKAAL